MSAPDARLRVLITGFGPFPGAPHNPTQKLVRALHQFRHPALHDVAVSSHIFDVAYREVDRTLPMLIARHRPHLLLMFGLAARSHTLRIETRALNCVGALIADAEAQHPPRHRTIAPHAPFARPFGAHTRRLYEALRKARIKATLSRDAGRYVCNYLSWRALELAQTRAPLMCSFIHVPKIAPRANALHALAKTANTILVYLVRETQRINHTRARIN